MNTIFNNEPLETFFGGPLDVPSHKGIFTCRLKIKRTDDPSLWTLRELEIEFEAAIAAYKKDQAEADLDENSEAGDWWDGYVRYLRSCGELFVGDAATE